MRHCRWQGIQLLGRYPEGFRCAAKGRFPCCFWITKFSTVFLLYKWLLRRGSLGLRIPLSGCWYKQPPYWYIGYSHYGLWVSYGSIYRAKIQWFLAEYFFYLAKKKIPFSIRGFFSSCLVSALHPYLWTSQPASVVVGLYLPLWLFLCLLSSLF